MQCTLLIMKKLEIIIPDRRLNEVNNILKEAHVGGLSYYRIEGRGRFKPSSVSVGRGTQHYTPEFIPRIKMEVVIKDEQAEELVKLLISKMGGQSPGGKVFIVDVPMAADLVTGEMGETAI
jgi:nitrogen regulatory protein P-II 1